jgi:hypothetical protein
MLKKVALAVVLLTVVVAAGFASVHFSKSTPTFRPHTIVYRLSNYNESEQVTSTDIVVRQVLEDGSWRHTQIREDGSVVHSSGRLAGPLIDQQTNADSPRHLGFAYIEDHQKAPSWISPDLQDFLMFTSLRSDGKKHAKLEAIDIATDE